MREHRTPCAYHARIHELRLCRVVRVVEVAVLTGDAAILTITLLLARVG